MNVKSFLTTKEIAIRFGVEQWQARRAVDALAQEIPRAGLYRLIPFGLLARVEDELKRRGYVPEEAGPEDKLP
jgi:hypothetical protein